MLFGYVGEEVFIAQSYETKDYIVSALGGSETEDEMLELYEEYGDIFPCYTGKGSVILIYDKNNKCLKIWRDPVGSYPLYYAKQNGLVYYSTNPIWIWKQLESKPWKLPTTYFMTNNMSAPKTVYEGIKEIKPGHVLVVQEDGITEKDYVETWKVELFVERRSRDMEQDEDAVIDKVKELLVESVKEGLPKHEPVSILLSGGLDSALITGIAHEVSDEVIHTYSLRYEAEEVFDVDKNVDCEMAMKLSRKWKTIHHEYTIDGKRAWEALERTMEAIPQPFSGGMALHWLFEMMPERVEHVMTGDGADEVFLGYPLHIDTYNMDCRGEGVHKKWFLFRSMNMPEDLLTVLVKNLDIEDIKYPEWDKNVRWDSPMNLDICSQYFMKECLPNQVFRMNGFSAIMHDKQIYTPYTNPKLLGYMEWVPNTMKMKDGMPKYILREVAKDYLPEDCIYRKKETFVPPILLWLENDWKEKVMEVLSYEHMEETGILNPVNVTYLLKRFYDNPDKQQSTGQMIWNLLAFQLWYDKHAHYFDNPVESEEPDEKISEGEEGAGEESAEVAKEAGKDGAKTGSKEAGETAKEADLKVDETEGEAADKEEKKRAPRECKVTWDDEPEPETNHVTAKEGWSVHKKLI